MIKKYITLAVAGIISCTAAFSQMQTRHEISVWGAGGFSILNIDSDLDLNKDGLKGSGIGGSFGVGYNYSFTEQWSINTGLELSFYNARITTDKISDRYNSNDGEYDFELSTTVSNYEEKQNTMFLNIPVMAQFEIPVFADNKFFMAGGFKLGIPVSKKYKIVNADIKNAGFYPIWNDKEDFYMDTQEFMGFGNFHRKDVKGDLDLKVACIVSLESGIKWKIGENKVLYTGAYLDYGLNDVNKDANKRIVEYNKVNPVDFISNSALSSQYMDNGKTEKIVDKAAPLAIGIKVRLGFQL